MPDNASIALIVINPNDNLVTVRVKVARTDADDLSVPEREVDQVFTFAALAGVNATQGATSLDGREWIRGAKRAAQKAVRQFFNGKTGAIATAITNLDPNG